MMNFIHSTTKRIQEFVFWLCNAEPLELLDVTTNTGKKGMLNWLFESEKLDYVDEDLSPAHQEVGWWQILFSVDSLEMDTYQPASRHSILHWLLRKETLDPEQSSEVASPSNSMNHTNGQE